MKRVKRRYLALRVEVEGVPGERELLDSVWGSVGRLFGEVGASLTGLVLIDFNVERKVAVIRVNLVSLSMVRASLAAITSVGGRDASVHVLGVSGTLNALFHNVG